MITRKGLIILLTSFCLVSTIFAVMPVSSSGTYNPWLDYNDDGKIDLKDVYPMHQAYGATGTPITKASIQYDSGWINITDKCGAYFTISHDLGSTSIMVDIQGKTTVDGGIHQKYYGLTSHQPMWTKTCGGTNDDGARSVVQTSDGGYALAGYTYSFGAGSADGYLVKTDASGNILWSKTYGGTAADYVFSVIQTSDGGYALAGATISSGAGSYDFYLIKTNGAGNLLWSRTYGGTADDEAWSVVQTSDGYALAGYTYSFGAGSADCYLVKTDSSGNMLWSRTYGGTEADNAYSVVQTSDSGYAIAGCTHSFGVGGYDFYLVRTDGSGNVLWSKTYGGTNDDSAHSVVQTGDGGYAIAGNTNSFGAGSYDFWLVKTDANGNMQWSKTYGGTGSEYGYTVIQTSEGGFAIAGYTTSFGAGGIDFYLVKTDSSGNMLWSRTYGGTGTEYGFSGVQTGDGGYAVAGYTSSFGAGSFDFHLVKTDVEQGLAWTDSTANTLTLYRGATDPYWNFVRVRVWQIKSP